MQLTEALLMTVLVPQLVLQRVTLPKVLQSMIDVTVRIRPKQMVNMEHLKAAKLCYEHDFSRVL